MPIIGERIVLAKRHAWHQPFLEPCGGDQGDAHLHKATIRLSGHFLAVDSQSTALDRQDAGGGLHQQPLAAALEPSQTDHFSATHRERQVTHCQAVGPN